MQSSGGFAETRDSFGNDDLYKDLSQRVTALHMDLENFKNEFGRWVKEL